MRGIAAIGIPGMGKELRCFSSNRRRRRPLRLAGHPRLPHRREGEGAGEILLAEPPRHLLTGKSYFYANRGEHVLKGIADPVRVFAVRAESG